MIIMIYSNCKASSFYCWASKSCPKGPRYIRLYKRWIVYIKLVYIGLLVIPKIIPLPCPTKKCKFSLKLCLKFVTALFLVVILIQAVKHRVLPSHGSFTLSYSNCFLTEISTTYTMILTGVRCVIKRITGNQCTTM